MSLTAQDDTGGARIGIRKALDDTLAAMRRGASADEIAKLIFTDDIVIAVGNWKTFHGLAEFLPTLADWVKEPIISWTIEEPIKVSGNLAVAYILEQMQPKEKGTEGAVYRSLWVFEKKDNGWRCSREALVGTAPDHQ